MAARTFSITRKRLYAPWLTAVFLSCGVSYAQPTLNFMPDNTGSMSTSVIHGGSSFSGQTPYLMDGGLQLPEVVNDPVTGRSYYHLIVGSLADGFIQEVYIHRGYTSFQGGLGSAVGGDGGASGGNGRDPLDLDPTIDSATGTANPTRVIMRQLMNDGEAMSEFVKDKEDRKPRISQVVNAPDINIQVELDMSNSSYSDMSTPGTMTNTMNLWGSGIPSDSASFDLATDADNSHLDAGMYTYTPGSGPGGSNGTYNYSGTSFDVTAQKWESFVDPLQNNPWSYSTNKP